MFYLYYIRPSQSDQKLKVALTLYLVVLSLIRIILLQPYKLADRKLKEIKT